MISIDDAKRYDAADELAAFRDEFLFPPSPSGGPSVYFVGNSLGLQPRRARDHVEEVLDRWSEHAVEGHFGDGRSWYRYADPLLPAMADLVGASVDEVAITGTLTANLHLLLASFYRPQGSRTKIVAERTAFPSDRYALASQIAWHGLDPESNLVYVEPGPDELYGDRIVEAIHAHADTVATVMVGGVNYLTGELMDLGAIAAAGRAVGATVGFDLAHAVGNVEIDLDGIGADFAAWCTYKYLNSGPGSVAALYVAREHAASAATPRLAGWWGNDPDRRFNMVSEHRFEPRPTAQSWEVSNPSILSMAPISASLDLFQAAGMARLRRKSVALTNMLESLLREIDGVTIITPRDQHRRGCQLSIRVGPDARRVHDQLAFAGVHTDVREPDTIRVAPVPLYNSFEDVLRFAEGLAALV